MTDQVYQLAEHCRYGDLRDEMIRDRIVVGLRDTNLSVKLQMEETLTLEKAAMSRQSKSVKKQQTVVRAQPATGESVDAVRAKVGSRNRQGAASGQGMRKPESSEKGGGRPHTPQRACMRCGKWPLHPQHLCPARDATCFNCQKIGHFQWCCKTPKSVGEVFPGTNSDDEGNDMFHGAVHDSEEECVSQWWVPLEVNSVPMKFIHTDHKPPYHFWVTNT